MPTLMPVDSRNHPIPALRFASGKAHAIGVTATTARNATAFSADTRVVLIYATGPVYLQTGDATVTASSTDHFFPEGVYFALSLGSNLRTRHDHIAVIRADGDCILHISEME